MSELSFEDRLGVRLGGGRRSDQGHTWVTYAEARRQRELGVPEKLQVQSVWSMND